MNVEKHIQTDKNSKLYKYSGNVESTQFVFHGLKHEKRVLFFLNNLNTQLNVEFYLTFCFSPVQLCASLGTTGVCAFDKLSELGPVCMSSYLLPQFLQ